MGDAPQEYTVEMYQQGDPWTDKPEKRTDEVMLEGIGRTLKVYRDSTDPAPDPGSRLKGWVNQDKGTFGVAKDRPQNGGGGRSGGSYGGGGSSNRDKETNESIQRQTAAKCAAEMAAAAGGDAPTLIANFEAYFDIVAAKIATGIGPTSAS